MAEPVGLPFLPHQLLTKVLTKLHQSNVQLFLVPQAWPAQFWFLDRLDLSINHPKCLPVKEILLRQPQLDKLHLDPDRLQLHTWGLSGDHLVRPDSPGRQQRGLQLPKPIHKVPLW